MAQVFDDARVTATNCIDSVMFRWHVAGQPSNSSCGTNDFPYEVRNVYVPVMAKIVIPAASNFTFVRVRFYWDRNIFGAGGNQCQRAIDKYLQPGDYSLSAGGDTLQLDFRQICAGSGFDYKQVNLYSGVYLDITVKYNQSVTGCAKDHLRPTYTFPILYNFETSRPMITTVNPSYYSGTRNSWESGAETPATLQWPGANNNTAALYAGNSIIATKSNVVVPVRYTVNNTTGLTANCWMAIPNTGGVTVDSVKIKTTGVIVPQTPPGSNIYQLGDLGGNGSTKDYDVYTHLIQCVNTPLNIYADRTPCTGYPTSWASYACQSSAKVSTFTYTTFPGELQMSDSLFYVNKDICTDDTVQFSVVNSQTQTTRNIKINLTLPSKMSVVPGRTYLSYGGTNNFVLTQDPVLNAGTYTWTMPATDTLAPIAQAPNNLLYLRVALTTDCGFKSGSQIYSSISGDVACGPVTRLFNTNPPALRINGAPSLSYFTNPKATVTQLTSCGLGPTGSQPIGLAMHISGGKTGADDSIQFILPKDYVFISYDPSGTGSHNAPAGQPAIEAQPDGTTLLSWASPANIVPGDSVVFSFFYNEKSNSNKCVNSEVRKGYLGTYITSGVFCVKTSAICPISIANGADTTVQFQTIRPSLSVRLDSVFFGPGSAPDNPYRSYHSSLHIKGVITNAGPGSVPPGTPIYMENFIDIDNSATINKADSQYNTYIYTGGIAAGENVTFEFWDSTSHRYCITCYQKALLTRFSDTTTKPVGGTQCLCDSSIVQVTPQTFIMLPLGLTISDFAITQKNCNTVEIHWKNLENPSPGDLFKIRISPDGLHFKDIQTIAAVDPAGTTYTRTVVLPAGTSYLKLGQLSNGKRYCTPTKKFTNTCSSKQNGLEVYPNPCWDGAPLVVKVEEATGGTIVLQALTQDGRLIKSKEYNVEAGLTEFGFADVVSLLPGSFIVRVQHADGSYSVEKVIKR